MEPGGHHPLGRPAERLRGRCPAPVGAIPRRWASRCSASATGCSGSRRRRAARSPTQGREYGRAVAALAVDSELFAGSRAEQTVWMNHGDSVVAPPPGFRVIASTPTTPLAGFENPERGVYAIQFHPEVRHTVHGTEILENFLFRICGVAARLDDGGLPAGEGRGDPAAGADGRRDLRALGRRRLFGHGDPPARGARRSRPPDPRGSRPHARARAPAGRRGLRAPRHPGPRRRRRGPLPVAARRRDATRSRSARSSAAPSSTSSRRRRGGFPDARYLAQGTLYPDVIESVSIKGPSAVIKTHHNVGRPARAARLRAHRARAGALQGRGAPARRGARPSAASSSRAIRFPGPGLAVRIPGEVTREKVALLQKADAIVLEEIRARRPLRRDLAGVRGAAAGQVGRRDGRRPHARVRASPCARSRRRTS